MNATDKAAFALQRSFKDGNPFADGATKAWLEEARGELGGGGGGVAAAGHDALAKATSEARKLLSEAKAPEAVARLAEQIAGKAALQEAAAAIAERLLPKLVQ